MENMQAYPKNISAVHLYCHRYFPKTFIHIPLPAPQAPPNLQINKWTFRFECDILFLNRKINSQKRRYHMALSAEDLKAIESLLEPIQR